MALIDCVECGRDISENASACPHCGAPLVTYKPSQDKLFPYAEGGDDHLLISKKQTRHYLHATLTILTLGIWGFVWAVVFAINSIHNARINAQMIQQQRKAGITSEKTEGETSKGLLELDPIYAAISAAVIYSCMVLVLDGNLTWFDRPTWNWALLGPALFVAFFITWVGTIALRLLFGHILTLTFVGGVLYFLLADPWGLGSSGNGY